MALPRDAYLALEDVVGPDFITEDTALLDTYDQCWGNRLFYDDKFATRPGAVLLPASTEEVQKIVRICSKYGIIFKPFSSGFENVSVSLASEKSILLDLRRMDRIIDIDEKNMRAVVEPYVRDLPAAAGVGQAGPLRLHRLLRPQRWGHCSSCAHFGAGTTQVFTSGLGRNVWGRMGAAQRRDRHAGIGGRRTWLVLR
jgi:glycolate oxidase